MIATTDQFAADENDMASNRAQLRHLWAAVAVVGAGTVWSVAYATAGAGTQALAYLFMPAGVAVAVLAVQRLVRTVELDAVAGRFWRGLLLAFRLIFLGYAGLAVTMLADWRTAPHRALPIPYAVVVGAGFGVAIWSVARVPTGVSGALERRRSVLDRLIAFLGCCILLWHVALAPMLAAPDRWSPQALALIMLAFLLGAGGITKVSYVVGDGPVDRAAMRLIAAAGLIGAAVAVLGVRVGPSGSVFVQAVLMPMAPVLVVCAVRAQGRAASGRRAARSGGNVLLPYLAVVAVDGPLIAVAAGQLSWPDRVVVVAAVVVTLLVALRQYLAFRDNSLLLSEKHEQEHRLQHEVTHDGLTGLANRALFRERLAAGLHAGDEMTVLLVDLDDFKTVNDSLGHDVGDRLLVSIADVLRAAAGESGLPVRVGGDEFAVLLTGPGCAGAEVAGRIVSALSQPVSVDRLLIQASIGIATASGGVTLDAVLRRADLAMYAAKQRGKASWMHYDPGMDQPVLAHVQLGGELRRALDNNEFQVFYQPIVQLIDGAIIGVEALVRWQHPTRGLVLPGEFIPAAERTGLIVPLGRFVLRETCRQTAQWLAEFGPGALQKVGPNVSARQLADPDFVADVTAALADHGLTTDRLVLELTESSALRGQQVLRTLHALDAMGVRLALDDFGTGQSSLSLLRSFPAAIVKLDKSFVDGIEIDDGDAAAADARRAVAHAVIELARALKLDTVAEGIENEAQAAALRELGYTLGQGFHLARPMSAENMTAMIARQRS